VADQKITVTQSAAGAVLSVTPATATLAAAAGSTATLSVTSNIAWTVQSDQPWLTVSPASGNGNGTIVLTASANQVTIARGALVTVSASGLVSQVVMVTQSPAATSLSASPVTLTVGAAAGSSATLHVVSNAAWTIASDQSWITVTPSSGTGNGTVSVTAAANTVALSRIATLTISAAGAEPQKVTVTQSALVPTLAVNPALLTVGAQEGSSSYFTIESNSAWSVTSNVAWISVTPSMGTGNGTVVVKASANGMAETRYGAVIVTATGLPGQQVVVMQAAIPTDIHVHKKAGADIQAYPNPFTRGFYLKNLNERVEIEVIDTRGRVVYHETMVENCYIHAGHLQDGFYLLKIIAPDGIVFRKIIKRSLY